MESIKAGWGVLSGGAGPEAGHIVPAVSLMNIHYKPWLTA
jgi:hypothetical protein